MLLGYIWRAAAGAAGGQALQLSGVAEGSDSRQDGSPRTGTLTGIIGRGWTLGIVTRYQGCWVLQRVVRHGPPKDSAPAHHERIWRAVRG